MKTFLVYWNETEVGSVSFGESDTISFQYAASWIASNGPAISLSMPVSATPYQTVAHFFFSNLLPEGDYRLTVERALKVSTDNDSALLKAIGGDCAGALSISKVPPERDFSYYEEISEEHLINFIKSRGAKLLTSTRLSLAGAQGKLPVRKNKTKFEVPSNGAPTTHIIKFNSNPVAYPCLAENEFLLTRVAKNVGLKTVDCEILKVQDQVVFVSKRYDRSNFEGWPTKLHQEDFCQAFGRSHKNKYQKDGGPSFTDCVNAIRTHLSLIEVQQVIDWFLFNFICGNCDAHAKNLSFLYKEDYTLTLAPFYDLVSTIAYENLDKNLAMDFGGTFNIEEIETSHFELLAKELTVSAAYLKQRYKNILHEIPNALISAKRELNECVGHSQWNFILKVLEKRLRVLLKKE